MIDAGSGDDGGCGCAIPRKEPSPFGLGGLAAALALVATRRRRD
jgi:MYXO-CTERM domain-containing protein